MDGVTRRAFGTLLAACAGSVSGCHSLTQTATTESTQGTATGRDDGPETVVTTREELEAAFEDLSPGETVRISGENAPYRTTRWLDIDADGVTVVGPGVRTLIEPADGADVGGFRIGHDERCREIDLLGVGYRGNPHASRTRTERLHGIAVRNATNVTVGRCVIRRTRPIRHGDGGSGISVARNCSGVRIFDTKISDFGDRGIQLGGERHMVYGNVVTNGLDRPIACDVWYPDAENRTARSVTVFGNLLGDSYQGSLVGVARNTPVDSDGGDVNVFGNVGFGSHKSFCHVRGPEPLRNITVQSNVSRQTTDDLLTEETTKFAGVAVDVAAGRNLAIKNNELYGYSGHGVHVDSDVSELAIQHNTVANPGLSGIRLVDGRDGVVAGNLVTGANRAGIRLKRASNVAVSDNYVRGVDGPGIITGGSDGAAGHDIADNYVAETGRGAGESDASPAVRVRDDGVRVRGNAIRGHGGTAIAESPDASGNVYADNWADGDDTWAFGPDSRVRDNVPATGAHRGVSGPGDAIRVEFDRAHARRPRLSFGRRAGGIREVRFVTDADGTFVGAEIVPEDADGTLDVFVDGA